MTSERRSVHGALPDGVADRAQGYTHNPNPEDELAAQRARFAERQRELQADRAAASERLGEIQHDLGEQYQQAQHDPEHQAMVAEQRAHQAVDAPHQRGGQEYAGEPEAMAPMPGNVELGRHAPKPTTPRDAEDFA